MKFRAKSEVVDSCMRRNNGVKNEDGYKFLSVIMPHCFLEIIRSHISMVRFAVASALAATFFVIFAIAKAETRDVQDVECVIQDHQVVLNTYNNGTLMLSQAIAGKKVTTWKRGNKSPSIKTYSRLYKDGRWMSGDNYHLRIFADGEFIFWEYGISKNCFENVLSK